MKIFKIALMGLLPFFLTSCLVSTAAKIVTTGVKIGYSAVKGTVKGVSWAVKKAEGKIDENQIDGTWKVVGIYDGTYEQFTQDQNPANNYKNECADNLDVIEFNANRNKFRPIHCETVKEDWIKYNTEFGKNPLTKNKENYFKYNSSNYISIINITSKTMVLEGKLMQQYAFSGNQLFLFEKIK
jgi:hypothetical protein